MGEAARKIEDDDLPATGIRPTIHLKPYQWKKGQSGNPSGKHGTNSALVNRIKELTGGGVEMIDVMVRLMRGEKMEGVAWAPNYFIRFEAAKWLAEYGFGKAPLQLNAGEGTYDLQRILLVELTKRPNDNNIFDVEPEAMGTENMAPEQSLQDPHKRPGNNNLPTE